MAKEIFEVGRVIDEEAARMGLPEGILFELPSAYFTAFAMLDDAGKQRAVDAMKSWAETSKEASAQ